MKSKFLLYFLLLSAQASAVNISNTNQGETLIFPYYTVNNGLNTLISVSNNSDQIKALKVRILEGDNAQEVLTINLYLSPFDVWTAAFNATETGAQISTTDNSCAPFLSNPQPLLDFVYTLDAGSDGPERMREGHIEILEMGTVVDQVLAIAAVHVNNVPTDCSAFEQAWQPGGQWSNNPEDGLAPATGSLKGYGVVVDVSKGTAVSYTATALESFYPEDTIIHTDPGSGTPNLDSADTNSLLIHQGEVIQSEWDRGVDAVSALLMHKRIRNDYVLNNGLNAQTELLVLMPTKSYYTQPEQTDRGPFGSVFDSPEGACEDIHLDWYNREEDAVDEPGTIGGPPSFPEICWTVNVIPIYNRLVDQVPQTPTPLLASGNVLSGSTSFDEGSVVLTLNADNDDRPPLADNNLQHVYYGLPVIGFGVQEYQNSNAQPGLLARYASIFEHSYQKRIEPAEEQTAVSTQNQTGEIQ